MWNVKANCNYGIQQMKEKKLNENNTQNNIQLNKWKFYKLSLCYEPLFWM